MIMNLDFSYKSYEKLLRELIANDYMSFLIGENGEAVKKLYLRHDVDTDYLGVIPLAEIENSLGLASTWYFLPDCPVYNMCSKNLIDIIEKICFLGHQVGLHVDASQFKDFKQMTEAIEKQFTFFSSFLPISKTFSFHKPAPWLLNNVCIPTWINAYQKEYYSEVMYVSDSNRREFWKEDRLYTAIDENKSLTLLTHPLWWKEESMNQESIESYVVNKIGSLESQNYLAQTCKIYGR